MVLNRILTKLHFPYRIPYRIKPFLLLFLVLCSFSELTQAQPSKRNRKPDEQILIQLRDKMTAFLTTVQAMHGKNQQQIHYFETELTKYQAKKGNSSANEDRKRNLQKRIAKLSRHNEYYIRFENEATLFIATIQNYLFPGNSEAGERHTPEIAKNSAELTTLIDKHSRKQRVARPAEQREDIHQLYQKASGIMDDIKQVIVEHQQRKNVDTAMNALLADKEARLSVIEQENQNLKKMLDEAIQPKQQEAPPIPDKTPVHVPVPEILPMIVAEQASSGYYIVFGSFAKKNNAEEFFTVLNKKYSNVVAIGNDNERNMYRIGIGPYASMKEATMQRPPQPESWILKVEFMDSTHDLKFVRVKE